MIPSLYLDQVSFYYEDDYPLFENLSLQFDPVQATAIVGPSGCGKTTLLHLLAGILNPHKGTVALGDKVFQNMSLVRKEALIFDSFSFIFSSAFLIPELTVQQNIELGLIHSLNQEQKAMISTFNLADKLSCYPEMLSSGQQQRVSVLRALLRPSYYVLADEPTAHLDTQRSHDLIPQLIKALKLQKRGFICVTHDRSLLTFFDNVIDLGAL